MKKKENFAKALKKLEEFLKSSPTTEMEKTAVIQAFEYTFETAWKWIQEQATASGLQCNSPKSSIVCGIQMDLIPVEQEKIWSQMLKDRNLTSHTYQEVFLDSIFNHIKKQYVKAFQILLKNS